MHTVAADGLDINVGHYDLRVGAPSLVFGKHLAVFCHKELGVEDKVGRRLAEPCRGISIGAYTACRLLHDERAQVVVFARYVVACR